MIKKTPITAESVNDTIKKAIDVKAINDKDLDKILKILEKVK